jgi:hypothetical protein
MSLLGCVGWLMLPPVGHGALPEAEQVRVQGSAETLSIIKCIAKRNMGRRKLKCQSVQYLGQAQGKGKVQACVWVRRAHLACRSPLRKQHYLVPHKGATCSVRSIAE